MLQILLKGKPDIALDGALISADFSQHIRLPQAIGKANAADSNKRT
jgi:hypothetical protein